MSSIYALLIRHVNEPDCIAAIECLRDANAALAFIAANPGQGHYSLPDIQRASIAANQVLIECEKRLQMEEMRKQEELHAEMLAQVQQMISGCDRNFAIMTWLRGVEAGGDDVAGDDPVGQDAA